MPRLSTVKIATLSRFAGSFKWKWFGQDLLSAYGPFAPQLNRSWPIKGSQFLKLVLQKYFAVEQIENV